MWCVAGFCGAVEFFGWLMIKLKNGMQLRHVWTLLLVLCLWCVAWFGLCVDWIVSVHHVGVKPERRRG